MVSSGTQRINGVDGWELEDFEWDPVSGAAQFDYTHSATFSHETVVRAQPAWPGHVRWRELGTRPQAVLTLAKG